MTDVTNPNDCLNFCKYSNNECLDFTFFREKGDCVLFMSGDDFDDTVEDAVSGNNGCRDIFCGDQGKIFFPDIKYPKFTRVIVIFNPK